jgi:hypothetical protein
MYEMTVKDRIKARSNTRESVRVAKMAEEEVK